MRVQTASLMVAMCVLSGCDSRTTSVDPTEESQRKTFSRLLASLDANRFDFDISKVPEDQLYDCVAAKSRRDFYSDESLFKRLAEYFRVLDGGGTSPPVDRT